MEQTKKVSAKSIFWSIALLALMGFFLTTCDKGFEDRHIEDIKDSIKREYKKNDGIIVGEVSMIRENNKKLIGFVRINPKDDVSPAATVTIRCSATMDDKSKSYLWRCGAGN